ncbi:thioredoxin domain-containing protein [Paenimyroides baculatum]|uniref:DUF4252 domain-containing protein n=1 Tax=Paenimyroides baculatum TaxID=2608000 RepID=A0A5M6C9A2_9FLAO|nr:hypothetical protein [Paenimyroides baculatum]KAA5531726.1 hypothetical protein F0460_15145 [Paenimyroides baculatum]
MKLLFSVLFLLLSIISLKAQTDCKQLLAQKINLYDDLEKTQLELTTNFSKLTDCGLDETDIVFFGQPPVLATLVIGWLNEDPETVTYQKLLDEILKMKATPEYKESVTFYNDFVSLRSKRIDLANWETDSQILLALVKDERAVNAIYQVIKEKPDEFETYGDMMDEFNKLADSMISNKEPLAEETPFLTDAEIIDYDELLLTAQIWGKPLLIYFTAYVDVNSRKMEEAFLNDSDIQEYLEANYYTVTLFVDEKKVVPKKYITKNAKTGKLMKTYGAFYNKIQEERFKNQSQPYFAIVSPDGKILKTQGFTLKKKEFKKFLK